MAIACVITFSYNIYSVYIHTKNYKKYKIKKKESRPSLNKDVHIKMKKYIKRKDYLQ